jgi:beta-glucosidase
VLWAIFTSFTAGALAAPATTPEKPKTVKRKAAPPATPRTADDAITPAVKDPKRHEQFLARIKEGPVGLLFLGDSITDGWRGGGKKTWQKFASYDPANFGIGGDRTEHVLWRITNGELEGIHPKVAVVMIGTNNTGRDKPEWIAAGVKKIVDTIHTKLPETKVLLLAVFPRGAKDSSGRKNVAAVNEIICKLDDGQKTRYLDIGKSFLDAEGQIPKDVMADGLHPSAKGYEIWCDAMRPLLEEMMK